MCSVVNKLMSSIALATVSGNTKVILPWAQYNFSSISGASSASITTTNRATLTGSSFTLQNSSTGTTNSPFGTWASTLSIPVKGLYRITLNGPRVNFNNSNYVTIFNGTNTMLCRTIISSPSTFAQLAVTVYEGQLEANSTVNVQYYSDNATGNIVAEGFFSISCMQAL